MPRVLRPDGTGSLSRALLALGNFPFLNERQQAGIGLVMDLVGLSLINVLDSNCFSVEVKDFFYFFFTPTCLETIMVLHLSGNLSGVLSLT